MRPFVEKGLFDEKSKWKDAPKEGPDRNVRPSFGEVGYDQAFAMNRKQRRMAAKHGKQIPLPAAPGTTIDHSRQIAELLAAALRHHQAGQLAQAERHYRKILAIDQNHTDSLHLLGVI